MIRKSPVRALVIAFGVLLPLLSLAQLAPQLQQGLQWLSARVQQTLVLGEDASSAVPLQVRSETMQTLRSLSVLPAPLADAVFAGDSADADTESLARRIVAGTLNARDVQPLLAALAARQNTDGGFGGGAGYSSHTLDSAWAVLALAQAGQGAGDAASRGRGWLAAGVVADGASSGALRDAEGVRASSLPLRLYTAALVSLALQTGSDGANVQAVQRLTAWLSTQQGGDGGWAGDTLVSAWVLLAVSPVSSDSGLKSAASTFLQGRQASDGSWNGDPYLTAVALRALTVRANPSGGSAGQAAIAGVIVDAGSGLPVPGANVAATPAASTAGVPASTVSDEQGRFTLSGLPAGSYAVAISRSGYLNLQVHTGLTGSQTADLGRLRLPASASTGIVRGTVTAQATGQALAGVNVALNVGSSAQNAATDSSGRFEFSSVPPGLLTVSASLGGYQPSSGNGSLGAGQTLVFSPALVRVGDAAPTAGRVSGQVVNAAGGAALAGVGVAFTEGTTGVVQTTTSAGDGRFSLTLAPGSYSARYTLAGFSSAEQRFVLTAGANANAGVVPLAAVRASSLVRGHVLSAAGLPVSGATVLVVGSMPTVSATTAADGSYLLDNAGPSHLTLRASAPGHDSQTVTLSAAQPTEFNADFMLRRQAASGLLIEALTVSSGTLASQAQLRGTATLANVNTAGALTAAGSFDVLDAAGRIVGSGAALSEQGQPLGTIELAPGQRQNVGLLWNSGQFPAGAYQLVLRLFEPDSKTLSTPAGNVLVERAAAFVIATGLRVAGSVTATPPVLRAGTNTPVRFTATLQNAGNAVLPAASYRLRVVNTQTQAVVFSTDASAAAADVAGLIELDFGNWTPDAAADLRVSVAAVDPAVDGSVSTRLYVGDAGSARFTTDRSVVPTGNQTVRAAIHVSGQDVAGGTISDPLAPLVKAAIVKAVTYADSYTYSHYVNDLKCFACHVQSQALVGGETNRKYVQPAVPLQRAVFFTGMNHQMLANGTVQDDGAPLPITNASLALWGAMSWHDKNAAWASRVQLARYLRSAQQAGGGWTADHSAVWWNGSSPLTALNIGSLASLHRNIAASVAPVPGLPALAPLSIPGLPGGDMRMDAAPDGTLYIANLNRSEVWRVTPDNVASVIVSELPVSGVRVLAGGDLLIAARNGVYRRSGSTLTRLTTLDSWDAIEYADGYLVSPFGGSTIYKLLPDGTLSPVYASSLLATSSGSLTALADGTVLVNSWAGRRLLRFSPTTGQLVETPAPYMRANPLDTRPYRGGHLSSNEEGLYWYDKDWIGERIHFERTLGLVQLPDGRALVNTRGGLFELRDQPIDKAAELTQLAASIDRATSALQNNAIAIDSSDNLHVAFQLMGLGKAQTFYQTTDRAAQLQPTMDSLAATLRSRQLPDGGWSWKTNLTTSDSMVTAIVGVALDFMNPSPDSPEVRRAVQLLLSRQQADGTWRSENGVTTVPLLATTWVEIWLPVMLDRLGGIDTRLTVDFAPTELVSGFSLAPTVLGSSPAGGQRVEWRLDGVTAEGRTVDFDIRLSGLAPGEQRPVATNAQLSFDNTFTGQPVTTAITVPVVRASAFLELTVSTDRPSYGADAPVLVSAPVVNGGVGPSSGSVTIAIIGPTGTVVADLGAFATGDIAAGATQTVYALWNTGASAAGSGYQAQATLRDPQGRVVNTAQAGFSVVGLTPQGVAARIAADRASYSPSDTVQLAERIDNLQANTVLEGLSARTTVRTAAGALVWQRVEPLSQLSAGLSKQFTYRVGLSNATAGRYSASLEVLDVAGNLRASATTGFDVADSAGNAAGLGGTLLALPRRVVVGEAVALQWSVINQGNSAYSGLPLAVRIIDPLAADAELALVAELPAQVNLAVGQTVTYAQSWTPGAAQADKTFVAALVAQVGGNRITLAQDRIQVSQPAVQIDLAALLRKESRVLALVSCPSDKDHDGDDDDDDHDAGRSLPASSSGPGHDDDDDDDDDESGGNDTVCAAERAQALGTSLTALGVTHKVVTSRAEFETELRCGLYDTYWLSGGSAKLSDAVVKQVREAVRRGDSLIVDGVHDSRNQLLHPALGVKQTGKLAGRDQTLHFLDTALYPAGTLATLGQPTKFTLLPGAIRHASFTARGNQPDTPAIVGNDQGQGRSLLFAFDLVGMLSQSGMNDGERDLLQRALQHLAVSAPPQVNVGAPVALGLDVRNGGTLPATVKVSSVLPPGARFLGASDGVQPDAQGRISWTLQLPAGGSGQTTLRLSWTEPGAQTIRFDVQAGLQADNLQPQGSVDANVQVEPASSTAQAALQQLQALAPVGSSQANARQRAIKDATQAQTLMRQQNHVQALNRWLSAADELLRITSVNTEAAALAIAQAIQATQRALCPQLACLTGHLTYSLAGQATAPSTHQAGTQAPLGRTLVQLRHIGNQCSHPMSGVGVQAQLHNLASGQTVLNKLDTVSLQPGQGNQRQDSWRVQGTAGQWLQGSLTATWQGLMQSLDTEQLQLVQVAPTLAGSVEASPATVKRGALTSLSRSVTNQGSTAQTVQVSVQLVNSQSNQVEQQWHESLTLQPGQSSSKRWHYAPQCRAGESLRVELTVTAGGLAQRLATSVINVTR